jgi:uncharacterized protein (DUF2236 family)
VADHFPRSSVIRRVNVEPAILFGAGRALALQLSHPAVAQGVQDHSEFKRNPFTRLFGTLEATHAVVFGSEALAEGVGRRIQHVHDHVTGPSYAANDSTNLLWVHATLLDTALRCYETLVGPLTALEAEGYYVEMQQVAVAFGLPLAEQPETLSDFRAYMSDTIESLTVTPIGVDLITFILRPRLPLRLDVPLAPLLSLQRLFTIATLPASLREQLGLSFTAADEERHARWQRRVHAVFRYTPFLLRTGPSRIGGRLLLRRARRHVTEFDAQQRARAGAG